MRVEGERRREVGRRERCSVAQEAVACEATGGVPARRQLCCAAAVVQNWPMRLQPMRGASVNHFFDKGQAPRSEQEMKQLSRPADRAFKGQALHRNCASFRG